MRGRTNTYCLRTQLMNEKMKLERIEEEEPMLASEWRPVRSSFTTQHGDPQQRQEQGLLGSPHCCNPPLFHISLTYLSLCTEMAE